MWQNAIRPCGRSNDNQSSQNQEKKKKTREMTSGINLAILKADE